MDKLQNKAVNYLATRHPEVDARYRPDEKTTREVGHDKTHRFRGSHKKVRFRAPRRIVKRNRS